MCETYYGKLSKYHTLCDRAVSLHIEPARAAPEREYLRGLSMDLVFRGVCVGDIGPGELRTVWSDFERIEPQFHHHFVHKLEELRRVWIGIDFYIHGMSANYGSMEMEHYEDLRLLLTKLIRVSFRVWLSMMRWEIVVFRLGWYWEWLALRQRFQSLDFWHRSSTLEPGRWFWRRKRTDEETEQRSSRYGVALDRERRERRAAMELEFEDLKRARALESRKPD